jgi:hypothetical protein
VVEKEGGLHDLCLVVSHTSLLGVLLKVGVVLGFFYICSSWVTFSLVF